LFVASTPRSTRTADIHTAVAILFNGATFAGLQHVCMLILADDLESHAHHLCPQHSRNFKPCEQPLQLTFDTAATARTFLGNDREFRRCAVSHRLCSFLCSQSFSHCFATVQERASLASCDSKNHVGPRCKCLRIFAVTHEHPHKHEAAVGAPCPMLTSLQGLSTALSVRSWISHASSHHMSAVSELRSAYSQYH
jgi:hypothetical protein